MYRQKSKLLKRFNGKLGVTNSKTASPSFANEGEVKEGFCRYFIPFLPAV
jgi:hypothetical protein